MVLGIIRVEVNPRLWTCYDVTGIFRTCATNSIAGITSRDTVFHYSLGLHLFKQSFFYLQHDHPGLNPTTLRRHVFLSSEEERYAG